MKQSQFYIDTVRDIELISGFSVIWTVDDDLFGGIICIAYSTRWLRLIHKVSMWEYLV